MFVINGQRENDGSGIVLVDHGVVQVLRIGSSRGSNLIVGASDEYLPKPLFGKRIVTPANSR